MIIDCPICGKRHEVEERVEDSNILYKGKLVTYKARYFECNGECFCTPSMLDENLEQIKKQGSN